MSEPTLTKAQRELLWLLSEGPRTDITDRRPALALMEKGLARFDPDKNKWHITAEGRALLAAKP